MTVYLVKRVTTLFSYEMFIESYFICIVRKPLLKGLVVVYCLIFISVFIILHFITMCCQPVLWVNASVYSDEIFEPKWRLLKIAFNGFVFSAFGFGLIVYFNRTWTGIHFCCSIVSAVTMLFWFLVPESPRWLAQNGEDDKAMKGNLCSNRN